MDELFTGHKFVRLDEQLNGMRNIKSEDELINLRKAAELADYAIEVGCREIAEGKTELEILMAIEFEMKRKGVRENVVRYDGSFWPENSISTRYTWRS